MSQDSQQGNKLQEEMFIVIWITNSHAKFFKLIQCNVGLLDVLYDSQHKIHSGCV